MDKTRKVISIVLMTLMILSLVFGLAKKVGLCADSGFSSFPLPFGVGSGYGYSSSFEDVFSQIDFQYLIDYGIANGLPTDLDTVIFMGFTNNRYRFGLVRSSGFVLSGNTFLDSVITYNYCYNMSFSDTNLITPQFDGGGGWNNPACRIGSSLVGGSFLPDTLVLNYPIYSMSSGINDSTNTVILFDSSSSSDDFWVDFVHGFVDDTQTMLEAQQDIIDSSTSQLSFWDKLLAWLYRINQNIINLFNGLIANLKSLFLPWFDNLILGISEIVSNIVDVLLFYDDLLVFLESLGLDTDSGISLSNLAQVITSSISSIFNSFLSSFWYNMGLAIDDIYDSFPNFLKSLLNMLYSIVLQFYNSGLVNGEFDLRTAIKVTFNEEVSKILFAYQTSMQATYFYQVYTLFRSASGTLENMFVDVPVPDDLSFTIPLDWSITSDDSVHTSLVLDFSWYANIKTRFLAVFMPFLWGGMVLLVLRSLPNIISGSSGLVGKMQDTLRPAPEPRDNIHYHYYFGRKGR